MKDYNEQQLESSRPSIDVLDGINYCLDAFFSDAEKMTDDFVANGLTFEEIIGVLLLARDEIKGSREE